MRILLHTCCGPCATVPVEVLQAEGHEITGYFYNPNIHPYTEFRLRLENLENYARTIGLPLQIEEDYDLEGFLRQMVFREGQRCRFCYDMRLRRTAQAAKEGGFEAFSTTLLISPYQNHDLLREMGEALGEEVGVPFWYQDFRPGFRRSVDRSKELAMYRQKYCGCIYSEKERYCRKKPSS